MTVATTSQFVSAKLSNTFSDPVEAFANLTEGVNRPSDIDTYDTLVSFATLTEDGVVNETTSTLAEAAGINPSTFRRSRNRLEEAGLIRVTETVREEGGSGPLVVSVNKIDRKHTNAFNNAFGGN